MSIKKAIAAGHICLDITPAFKSKEEKNIKDLFRPGQLIAMDAAKVSLGGSVSNTGVGMKRLGADVELMGMVGDDAFGQMVLNELEKYGASPESMIVRKGVGTSYSVILAPAGIDRIFLHCSGANDTFTLDDIDLEKVKGANLFHFGYPSLMRKMYIDGGKELVRLLKAVHEQGVAKGNEAPMVYIANAEYCADGMELIKLRNILFTSITRSRAWVRVCGVGEKMQQIQKEYNQCVTNDYDLHFRIPTDEELKKARRLNRERTSTEKRILETTKDNINELIDNIEKGTVDSELLPELNKLMELLKRG